MELSQATSRSQASFPEANTVIITINQNHHQPKSPSTRITINQNHHQPDRAHSDLPKPFCWSLLRPSPRTEPSAASVKDSRRRKALSSVPCHLTKQHNIIKLSFKLRNHIIYIFYKYYYAL